MHSKLTGTDVTLTTATQLIQSSCLSHPHGYRRSHNDVLRVHRLLRHCAQFEKGLGGILKFFPCSSSPNSFRATLSDPSLLRFRIQQLHLVRGIISGSSLYVIMEHLLHKLSESGSVLVHGHKKHHLKNMVLQNLKKSNNEETPWLWWTLKQFEQEVSSSIVLKRAS